MYTLTTPTLFATNITGFRLEALSNAAFGGNGPGRQPSNGNFVLTEFEVDARNQAAAVPEPATMGLVFAGLSALVYSRRRRVL